MTETDRLEPGPRVLTAPTAETSVTEEFRSVLFDEADEADVLVAAEPPHFADLNLDRVVASIVAHRDEYDLKPFFYTPLRDANFVEYRHAVFRDLEVDEVRAAVGGFAAEMQWARRYLTLATKQHYKYEKERWFVDAAARYCDAVEALLEALNELQLRSRGFQALRGYLGEYASSERFTSVASDARTVLQGLDSVRYALRIKGARVTVTGYEDEADYSVEVEETFARFRQGAVESHLLKIPDSGSMDHVEARIAELVARLYPKEFGALDRFCAEHGDFVDARVARFDREVQFYLSYLEYSERLAGIGLSFCYPEVSVRSKESCVERAFDSALATKLVSEGGKVVCNDFSLQPPERIIVVTGPNQGGKTTFARMFAQLHYLAALGVPVPGRAARLFLPDRVFTHFEKEEDIRTLRGKLDDELVRVREILEQATGDSLVTLNEAFASTTLNDALYLGMEVLRRLSELGCLAVWVTFVDELASFDEATVSMVATVAPDDPSVRTFEVVRKLADGRAYASAIADKYGLSYDRLRKRITE